MCGYGRAFRGSCQIDGNIHYYLSVLTEAIIADEKHKENGLWHWNIKEELKEHYNEIRNYE